MTLDRAGLIGKAQCPTEEVDIGGEKVIVKGMTARQVTEFQKHAPKEGKKGKRDLSGPDENEDGMRLTALLIAQCLVDGEGKRMFGDDDLDPILDMPMTVLTELRDAAMRVSGMTAQSIEEASGNS